MTKYVSPRKGLLAYALALAIRAAKETFALMPEPCAKRWRPLQLPWVFQTLRRTSLVGSGLTLADAGLNCPRARRMFGQKCNWRSYRPIGSANASGHGLE